MGGVKRKLASRQGATLVLALVVFLILTMFSAELTLGSLTALQDSVLLRNSEKAYASVNSAARLIQNSLRNSDAEFIEEHGRWRSAYENKDAVVQSILLDALNAADGGRVELIWRVKSDGWSELEDAFTDVPLTVTAEYRTDEALADFVNDNSPCKPTVTIRFRHPDYKMTMRVTARSVETVTDESGAVKGYRVKFAEHDELDIALSLGAS